MNRWVLSLFTLCCFLAFSDISFSVESESGKAVGEEKEYKIGDPELDVLWITEKSGEFLPLDTVFIDEKGASLTLGEFIDRPTLILPIYFYCPSSCSLNLVNLTTALKRSQLKPGKDFKVIALSFNEKENEENARIAKRNYLRLLPKTFNEENWKFLTGTKESIDTFTNSIGYSFKKQEDGMFIHPSALVAVAADGMIIKYVYGSFVPGDVDMAMAEAENRTPSMSIKRFLGYCFNYDPIKSRTFFQNLKLAVLVSFGFGGLLFFLYLRRSGKKNKKPDDEH